MPETSLPKELTDSYDVRETIGSGGFAKVKLGIHRLTNEKVAIKMMNKKTLGHDLPRIYTEIESMKHLCHQHICQLYEVIETDNEICMILEYAPGGELFDYIVANDRLKEEEARGFLRQIVCAVAYMHDQGYAHRDLKPENLLLDENQVIKLIDFGLVGKPEGGMSQPLETCCGSPAYAAPELISGVPYFGNEADLWSMGVLLYALLCGFLPFDDDDTYALYKAIQPCGLWNHLLGALTAYKSIITIASCANFVSGLKGKYETPGWLSKGSNELIKQLLTVDPKKRATVKQLMYHSWLNKGYAAPVHWETRVKKDKPESDVIAELALFYGVSSDTVSTLVKQYHYDDLTGTYFLLCKKKSRGGTPRLSIHCSQIQQRKRKEILTLEKKISTSKHESSENNNDVSMGSPVIIVDDEDDVFSTDLRGDFRKPRSCTLPPELVSTPPICAMPPGMPSELSLTPHLVKRNMPVPSSVSNYEFGTPISPKTKVWSQSLDRDLDTSPWTNGTPLPSQRRSAGRRFSQKAIFDSIEGGINKFLGVFTPGRTSNSRPRKVKELYNVSTITNKSAEDILDELKKVVEMRDGWMSKISGYTLRCKTVDDRGKVILDFELEVCEIPKIEKMGIRRKRLKGDTWAYKKMCEEILKEADL